MKIGDFDESDPNGSGYKIMTISGLKVFDLTEREEYQAEKAKYVPRQRSTRARPLPDPTRQCRKCHALHSSRCLPPVVGVCKGFIRYVAPRQYHYA